MAETGYRHGVKTRLVLDDAESNLPTTQTNLARGLAEYPTARTRLLSIMGENPLIALSDPTFGSACQRQIPPRLAVMPMDNHPRPRAGRRCNDGDGWRRELSSLRDNPQFS